MAASTPQVPSITSYQSIAFSVVDGGRQCGYILIYTFGLILGPADPECPRTAGRDQAGQGADSTGLSARSHARTGTLCSIPRMSEGDYLFSLFCLYYRAALQRNLGVYLKIASL